MTQKILQSLANKIILDKKLARLPVDEVILEPKPNECVVFRECFIAGLRFPLQDLLEEILDAYNIEMHYLMPNGVSKIALFVWAAKSQKLNPDNKAFCVLHEMHNVHLSWQMLAFL